MKDLMLLLASVMPFEMLIDELEKAIKAYREDPTEENKNKISSTAMLLSAKGAIDNTEGGVEKIMEDTDRMRDGFELLNPKKG